MHQVHTVPDVLSLIENYDLLFLDDCLYSQYVFLKKNIQILKDHHVICVLGFSTQIIRDDNTQPDLIADCKTSHDLYHAGELTDCNPYMSLSEIKNLLQFDNVFLACHGAQHLELEYCSGLVQLQKFKQDLKLAIQNLKEYGLQTDIFVFPYDFEPFLCHVLLKDNQFRYAFGKNRTYIEDLVHDRFKLD